MASIPVRASGGGRVVALVDDADHARLARFHWRQLSSGYVARRQRHRGGRRVLYLHREVVGATHGDLLRVEHVNGDKLDNHRANLRVRPAVTAPEPGRVPGRDPAAWSPEDPASTAVTSVDASHALPAPAQREV
jgi:hypothetical protein